MKQYIFGRGESIIGYYGEVGVGLGTCKVIGNIREEVHPDESEVPETVLAFASIDSVDFFIEHLLAVREKHLLVIKDIGDVKDAYSATSQLQEKLNKQKSLLTKLNLEE